MNPLRAAWRSAFWVTSIARHPANRGARAAAVRRAVRWEVRTRLTHKAREAEAVVDGRTRLLVVPGQMAGVWTAYNGLHEWEELQLCLGYLRPGDHFVDVGANMGVFTCLVGTRIPNVRITAIEPYPPMQEALRHNISLNDLDIDVRDRAVGSEPGSATFEVLPRDVLNRLAPAGAAVEGTGITVEVDTLDHLLGDATPALIKIDVEGFELEVLRGATGLMAAADPPVLVFECVGHAKTFGHTTEELLGFVREQGYQVLLLDGDLTPWTGAGLPPTPNVVAAKDPAAVRRRLAEPGGAPASAPVRVELSYR